MANSVGLSISISLQLNMVRPSSRTATARINKNGVRAFLGTIGITKRWVQELRGVCWTSYETYWEVPWRWMVYNCTDTLRILTG